MIELLALAQIGSPSISNIAIFIIVVAAIVGIVIVAVRQSGVAIPGWVVQVFWICLTAFVCVIAVKFLIGLF
jgi:hypothetical protein